MDCPVYDGKERIGTLAVRREGLYAVFTAELPAREGLPRLWLCGTGESVCLGLLEPRGGTLRLEKRLSRAACAALPAPPLYATLSPERAAPAPEAAPSPPKDVPGAQVRLLFGRRFIVFRS